VPLKDQLPRQELLNGVIPAVRHDGGPDDAGVVRDLNTPLMGENLSHAVTAVVAVKIAAGRHHGREKAALHLEVSDRHAFLSKGPRLARVWDEGTDTSRGCSATRPRGFAGGDPVGEETYAIPRVD